MPSYTVNLTAADASDLVDALCDDYLPLLADGTVNPQTRAAYAKTKLARLINNRIKTYRIAQAAVNEPAATVT